MNHTYITIEKMQLSEIDEVAAILTDAFKTNPAYSIIFNETDNPAEGLMWLFKTNLFLLNRKQQLTHVVREKDSGKIVGTYSLIPPEGAGTPFSAYFHIGIPRFISDFGFSTLRKMMSMDDLNKETLKESIKTNGYYYLSIVVIKEEYRGMGVGSYAIRNCLESLSLIERDCNIVGLTTQLPENVSFYSKLGFEKIGEGEISFKNDKYYNYNMKYVIEDNG